MGQPVEEIRHHPLFWLLPFVPVVFVCQRVAPQAQTPLFLLSILAIVPLAALLSRATESISAKTGDAVAGLVNATLGNLTDLIIGITALRAGQYALVKASVAGGIVTNALFMLGVSFLLGGLEHHKQEFNAANVRLQAVQLFLATVALVVPSTVSGMDATQSVAFMQTASVCLAVLLIAVYSLGLLYSFKTHPELFGATQAVAASTKTWPIGIALVTLATVTVLMGLTSEIFVESVGQAAEALRMTPEFVGFIVVALAGGVAEMTSAFSAARRNRLDLSISIALGGAAQISLFVAPVLVLASYALGPAPMNLQFWPGAVVMVLIATLTASLVANSARATWFSGVLVLAIYLIFAITLYLLPPTAA